MKRITVPVQIREPSGSTTTLNWKGWSSDTPGLGAIRAPVWSWDDEGGGNADPSGQWVEGYGWQVVHLGSGWAVHGTSRAFNTRRDALATCAALGDLVDWTQDAKTLADWSDPNGERLFHKVQSTLERHGLEGRYRQ